MIISIASKCLIAWSTVFNWTIKILKLFLLCRAVLITLGLKFLSWMATSLDVPLDDLIKSRNGRGRGRGRGQGGGRGRSDGQRLTRGSWRGRGTGTFRGRGLGVPSRRPLGVNTRSSSFAIAKASTKLSLFFCIPSRIQIIVGTWEEVAINLLKGDSPMVFDSGHICYLYTVELQRGSNGFLVSKYQRTGPFLLSMGGEIYVGFCWLMLQSSNWKHCVHLLSACWWATY